MPHDAEPPDSDGLVRPVMMSDSAGRELALKIADIMSDTPATDTLVLDLHQAFPFSDYFVICSGENERQLRAIARSVGDELAKVGIRPHRSEGVAESGWILIDFNDVIVHIFSVDQRDYYRLEELWADAQTVLSIQ